MIRRVLEAIDSFSIEAIESTLQRQGWEPVGDYEEYDIDDYEHEMVRERPWTGPYDGIVVFPVSYVQSGHIWYTRVEIDPSKVANKQMRLATHADVMPSQDDLPTPESINDENGFMRFYIDNAVTRKEIMWEIKNLIDEFGLKRIGRVS